MSTSRFFNDPQHTVAEMLDALASCRPLRRSDGDGVQAVVAENHDPRRVAVVSGGGSGHEPAHAGLVGDGLLTAAVCGAFFASPSVEAVLAVIREVTGTGGCLLVVKNYTGDRLNFGLAAERARAEGLAVEVVLVADDIALPDNPQPRGLAGTVLVHKVAGDLARAGAPLSEVATAARAIADDVATLSLSLTSALLPGQSEERRTAELGLGIHNEPGARAIDPAGAHEAMSEVLEPLLAVVDERHGPETPLVALLNDTGSCSTQELTVLAGELLTALGDRLRLLVGPAPLMTSVDMHGFSVTLAVWSEERDAALTSPVGVPDWPAVQHPRPITTFTPRPADEPEWGTGERDDAVAAALRAGAQAVVDARADLDALDARVGDGDAGATLEAGARGVLEALDADRLSTGSPDRLATELAAVVARTMGGSSGVVLSILATATAARLADDAPLADALAAGIERVTEHGGAHVGDRTLLDALAPARQALADGGDAVAAARAGREGADTTASVTRTIAGRSSYLRPEDLDGVVDPGAEAVARFLAGWAGAVH
ncbi:dihydroxyacetone kinase subunit DhaK [Nocardioides acrostichi]|uniref:Dihydroxyacetone kinase subunit DhaK n=1 Tax=Nocardioides acrostichi TaxID=2784339 RepID=A0A930Y872_9ACTN|nr:dihydroxyacetone kinase subunit DhaK [Nocardioides acrostichi]MBF4162756.1 dihydroxyacetone kinase subunit DhaK [Nocardioides acrostichi]